MKIAAFTLLMISGSTLAEDLKCLNFVEGLQSNKVQDFLLAEKITEKEKDGLVVYSAAHDLNDDGSPEYFYLLQSFDFCGMNNWCSIKFFAEKESEFVRLKKNGVIVHDWSKMNNVVCFGEGRTAGWRDLIINGHLTIKYTNGFYER